MAVPSLIVRNARVITMDPSNPSGEAFACVDGRVVAVGDTSSVAKLAGPNTRVLDAEGAVVLPGFIDVHSHFELMAQATELSVDYRSPGVSNIGQIIDRLRARAQETPAGEWIVGQGTHFQDTLLDEKRYPDRHDLDKASTIHPILARFSGHTQIFNTVGLQRLGLTRDTPDPHGGRIERDEHGEPTGRTYDIGATTNSAQELPSWPLSVMRDAIRQVALKYYAARGITSVGDIQLLPQGLPALVSLYEERQLPCRVANYMTYPTVISLEDAIEKRLPELPSTVDPAWIRWAGIKLFADGGITAANAAMHEPYTHEPHNSGLLLYTEESLAQTIEDLAEAGHQVIIHAIGDRSVDTSLDAFARLKKRRSPELGPHRIEHGGILYMTPERVARFISAGVLPVPQPAFIWGANRYGKYIGPERAFNPFPYRTLLNAGLLTPGNSDAGGAAPDVSNPFFAFWCLVTRQTAEGNVLDMREALTVEEGLQMYTVWSAAAQGESKDKGSLEVGKLADFILLDDDPREVSIEQVKLMEPRSTWVNGELVYGEAGRLS